MPSLPRLLEYVLLNSNPCTFLGQAGFDFAMQLREEQILCRDMSPSFLREALNYSL